MPADPSAPVPTTIPTTLLPTLPGLGRPGTAEKPLPGNPTMSDLMDRYDPALVSLLVPGMVQR